MTDFPASIYAQRTLENVAGRTFDSAQTRRLYAEDMIQLGDEVTAIETVLGVEPQGAYATVKAWITALAAALADVVSVPSGGTTGQVLTKASNADFDVDWEDAGGGGAVTPGYTQKAASGGATGVSSITISGLDIATDGLYRVHVVAHAVSAGDQIRMRVNGDSGSNYAWSGQANGGADSSSSQSGMRCGMNASKAYHSVDMLVSKRATGDYPTFLVFGVAHNGGSGPSPSTGTQGGTWNNTANITSLTFYFSGSATGDWTYYIMKTTA